MHLGHHHQSLRRKGKSEARISRRLLVSVDILAYAATLLSLLFTLDQIRIIWVVRDASGVSLLSWTFYTLSSVVWLLYGYVHKDRILIITNGIWVLFSVWIVVGIILFGVVR